MAAVVPLAAGVPVAAAVRVAADAAATPLSRIVSPIRFGSTLSHDGRWPPVRRVGGAQVVAVGEVLPPAAPPFDADEAGGLEVAHSPVDRVDGAAHPLGQQPPRRHPRPGGAAVAQQERVEAQGGVGHVEVEDPLGDDGEPLRLDHERPSPVWAWVDVMGHPQREQVGTVTGNAAVRMGTGLGTGLGTQWERAAQHHGGSWTAPRTRE